jgi:hypothetical protein
MSLGRLVSSVELASHGDLDVAAQRVRDGAEGRCLRDVALELGCVKCGHARADRQRDRRDAGRAVYVVQRACRGYSEAPGRRVVLASPSAIAIAKQLA